MSRKTTYLKYQYGISLLEYQTIIDNQGGRCVICYEVLDNKRVHIDHDHVTGMIRGILCLLCNIGIGHLKDDPIIVRRALNYLEGKS